MKAWEEREGLVAMHQIRGVGWGTLNKLRQAGWDPGRPAEEEEMHMWREAGIPSATIHRIQKKWTPRWVEQVAEELAKREIQAVTLLDDDYPPLLGQLPQPPWVLYVRGDVSYLQGPGLAVVGTRKTTSYGKQVTRQFAGDIAKRGWTVVSGLAAGVDGEAHRAALEVGGRTVAVLGCGVDVVYPRHHRDLYKEVVRKGAVISEAPPGMEPHPGLFPQRNRIISGLSWGTLVVEAAEKSGSLITAHHSLEQGREVFAVPGPVTSTWSQGTNRLIREGAKCVIDAEDLWTELTFVPQPETPSQKESLPEADLEPQEQVLLELLGEHPLTVDSLADRTDMSLGELHRQLLQLQVKGWVRQLPGAQFMKK
ncbi:DNA-processing protein DprA [Kroppenstedtia sanguinis]|uniref:DNA-processing protein DprA n=1 Tax=Kroppenstedtia sanguinis TaxID=1380684 RepID=A0ABW4C956_9BACL